jgi:TDG/mug DNA glycosylase family protein
MRLGKPSKDELLASVNMTVPDVIAPRLHVLFCGINPGLYSAATGHHFARPGNRFWPTLYTAGFTSRLLSPREERELLQFGLGITNIVARATASAAELTPGELNMGARRLRDKVRHYRPRFLAMLGVSAYRSAFGRPGASLGCQVEVIGNTTLWVLPNPSGLSAHYQRDELARLFGVLRHAVEDNE